MTDAERQALTVGQVVYYLDDQGIYWGAKVRIAPWKNALDNWLIVFENDPLRCFDLTLVIGRDLADVDAHRITAGWTSITLFNTSSVALTVQQAREKIADAIRAAEQRGREETACEVGDALGAAK